MARNRHYHWALCSALFLFCLLNLGFFTSTDFRGYLELYTSSFASSSTSSRVVVGRKSYVDAASDADDTALRKEKDDRVTKQQAKPEENPEKWRMHTNGTSLPLPIDRIETDGPPPPSPAAAAATTTGHDDGRLELVHIPKTGGTALEAAAAASHISWGICHYMIGQLAKCPATAENELNTRLLTPTSFRAVPQQVPLWHLPPRVFFSSPSVAASGNSSSSSFQLHRFNPYRDGPNVTNNVTLFAVVRNPYNRVISEYFFQHEKMTRLTNHQVNNATRLNTWLQQRLQRMSKSQMTSRMNDDSDHYYYQDDGHFIPQYDYVYDNQGQRLVQHVVYLEQNLHDQLLPLFRAFDLEDILEHLPNHSSGDNNNNNKTKKSKKKATTVGHLGRITSELTMVNITLANRRLIEQVYARDFETFGYDMMPTTGADATTNDDAIADATPTPAAATNGFSLPSSSSRDRRRLEMVHIPKTGGTAVGRVAAAAKISWSICHYMAGTLANCPSTNETKSRQELAMALARDHDFDWAFRILPPPRNVPAWHLPPRFFYNPKYKATLAPYNPYGDTTATTNSSSASSSSSLFAIVRNPYNRALSEYFFQQEKNPKVTTEMVNDAQRMNAWLYKRLSKMVRPSTSRRTSVNDNDKDDDDEYWYAYYQDDGHFIPQYDYVFDDNDRRLVEHVMHMEALQTELPPLFKRYALDDSISLDKITKRRSAITATATTAPSKKNKRVVGHLGRFESHLSAANLTMENQRLIETIYARDFSAFGYSTMTTNAATTTKE